MTQSGFLKWKTKQRFMKESPVWRTWQDSIWTTRRAKQHHNCVHTWSLLPFCLIIFSLLISCSSLTFYMFFVFYCLLIDLVKFWTCFVLFSVGRRQFARHEWAQKAAYVLGCSLEELSSLIFKHQTRGLQPSTSFRGGPDDGGQGDGAGKNPSLKADPPLFIGCKRAEVSVTCCLCQALSSQLWSVWRPWHQDCTLSSSLWSSLLSTGNLSASAVQTSHQG